MARRKAKRGKIGAWWARRAFDPASAGTRVRLSVAAALVLGAGLSQVMVRAKVMDLGYAIESTRGLIDELGHEHTRLRVAVDRESGFERMRNRADDELGLKPRVGRSREMNDRP